VWGSRVLTVVVVGVVATAAGARENAPAPAFVIQGDRVIAGVAMGRGTVNQALARFGTPKLRRARPPACLMTWPRLGLSVTFVSFEGAPCTKGVPVVATVTNRGRWRTALGLRVGDGIPRVKTLFPRAVRRTTSVASVNGFWLVPRRACGEVGGDPFPGLLARIRAGRVSALVVRAGVCE
jgi:hypothetical protein